LVILIFSTAVVASQLGLTILTLFIVHAGQDHKLWAPASPFLAATALLSVIHGTPYM